MRRWHVGAVDRGRRQGFGRPCWTRKGALRLARRYNMIHRSDVVTWVVYDRHRRQVDD
jgi:hypothetical protein